MENLKFSWTRNLKDVQNFLVFIMLERLEEYMPGIGKELFFIKKSIWEKVEY